MGNKADHALLQRAVTHHQAGRLDKAETAYKKLLKQAPGNARAMHLHGLAAHQRGQHQVAAERISRAIALNPADPDYHSNMGVVLRALGRLDEAAASCKQAIDLDPLHPGAHNNLANVLLDQGHTRDAIACYQRVLELRPGYSNANYNLGNALLAGWQLDDAIRCYRNELAVNPTHVETHHNMGTACLRLGQLDMAAQCLQRAIELNPDCVDAYVKMGSVHADAGNMAEALAWYSRALEMQPDNADTCNCLAGTLKTIGSLTDAISLYRRTLEIEPRHPSAHSNLLYVMNNDPAIDANTLFNAHLQWAAQTESAVTCMTGFGDRNKDPSRRLRIGYVSADFRAHSVASFIEPVLRTHDHRQVEVFCYANVEHPDAVTARLRDHADHWCDTLGLHDDDVAARISADRIDILVDLAGHTANNRLAVFARRPAPVQVSYLGYPNTTGLTAMDYRITDARVDPPGTADDLHSETLVRLADGFLCYQPPLDAPPPAPLPALASGTLTFGCFNTLAKITATVIDTWAALLVSLPQARLLIKTRGLDDPAVRQQFMQRLSGRGIAPDRVDLLGPTLSTDEHLATYGQVDIAIDTFPYNGTTTTCEALWMGVPVITLEGSTHAGRVGASLLSRVGLEQCIAQSAEEYVARALALAGDLEHLANLRSLLRSRMQASELMNADGFTRGLEAAYRDCWSTWCGP